MSTIALEEHFATKSSLRATGAPLLPRVWPQSEELQPRLLDIGAGRIAAMDEALIDFQVLSLSAAIGLDAIDAATACLLARDINDELADAMRTHRSEEH